MVRTSLHKSRPVPVFPTEVPLSQNFLLLILQLPSVFPPYDFILYISVIKIPQMRSLIQTFQIQSPLTLRLIFIRFILFFIIENFPSCFCDNVTQALYF